MIQVTKKIIRFILQDRNKFPSDKNEWPSSWKKVTYKIYEKSINPKITSIENRERSQDIKYLQSLLEKRKSSRNFSEKEILPQDVLDLLILSSGVINNENHSRTYPSGGKLYPVEVYYLSNTKDKKERNILERGLYHFSPLDNSISLIKKIDEDTDTKSILGSSYDFTYKASGFIILTITPKRNVPKYGWLGIRLGLIEIGEIIQNIYLISAAMNINCCAVAGFSTEKVDDFLDIDGLNEISIVMVAIG